MRRWSLDFSSEAERDLSRLDRTVRRRIINKLDWFLENFEAVLPSILVGEFREFYKLRIGDWRVMYKIDWQNRKVEVSYIDHRGKVYKKR